MAPIYGYTCESCKHDTDLLTSIQSKPDFISCEKCGKPSHPTISGGSFKVNGYNAANNYSRTNKERRK